MGLIQPEAKNLWQTKLSRTFCWRMQCAVFHLQHDKSHEEERAEINPFHPNKHLPVEHCSKVKLTDIIFFPAYTFPSKKPPINQENFIPTAIVKGTLKCLLDMALYSQFSVPAEIASTLFLQLRQKYPFDVFAFSSSFYLLVPFAVKEQFFPE